MNMPSIEPRAKGERSIAFGSRLNTFLFLRERSG
jgi:hypothetical protein